MTKQMLQRIRKIFILVIIIFILLTGRLAYLQIMQHDYYWYRAERNRFTKVTLVASRGDILDRNGNVLVTNRPGYVVSLMDMGEGYDPETIAFLSEILELDEKEIYNAIAGQAYMRYLPLRLMSDITPEIIAQISENRWRLKGVNIDVHPIRDYRAGETAAHVLGYLNQGTITSEGTLEEWARDGYDYKPGDLVGHTGLERVWEPWLQGSNGEQRIETNHLGQAINYFERVEPEPGHNLQLTLDLDLQKVAEEALVRRIEALQEDGNESARRGSAIVLDPSTGAILAMANSPSFDLNTHGKNNEQIQELNLVIQGTYPIGSTFKMVTGAAVLEEGLFGDRERHHCAGIITVDNESKTCYRGIAHGSLNFYDAMAVSCNIYFYRAGLAVGIDDLARYAREFGFGSVTGLTDLPFERAGLVASREVKAERNPYPWYRVETMDAAIGQGFHNFTPLQLANYAAIIANGGTHYRPYLVEKVTDGQGNVVKEIEPEALRQADLSGDTLSVLQEGMLRVTRPRGTAYYHFSHLDVDVAGKTGSAEVTGFRPHSLFVGYAPYENPEIVVAVIIEHGGIGFDGGVPVAAEIMEYYFAGTIKGDMDTDVH